MSIVTKYVRASYKSVNGGC